jgi:type IV secretion system protein VirD4
VTARTTTEQAPRQRTRAEKAATRWLLILAAAEAPALALHSLPLAVLGILSVLVFAVCRLRKAHRRWRSGGKAAARSRAKYQGTATKREIRSKLSPRAVRKRARATCPGLHPSEACVVIGRARRQVIADAWSGSRLVYAPPQTLKTGLTACWAADAPGALLAFSSRCDQYDHTYLARRARGRVWVLNADGEGGIPTDFAWSPVDGCRVRRTAMRRAGDLMAAAPHDPSGRDAHWDGLSKLMLQYLLMAADLLPDGNIVTVKVWASQPLLAGKAAEVLRLHDPDWGDALVAMVTNALNDERYWSAISNGVSMALAWLDDGEMAAAACPPPGEGIDLRKFIEDGTGTIYVIGADREHGSLAPYFAAFGAEAFHVARSVAEAQPGRRLRRPFVIVADEAATIVPLPWDKITAVSSGYGIGITACVQADSQITERWGEHRAKTIRTNFTVKIIGPGFTDPGELADLSVICGDRDTWEHASADGTGTRHPARERLYPPERIRLIPDWHALVLHRNARPVEIAVTPVWKRRGYERVQPAPAPALPQRPAIEAGRRGPIAPPYLPAAVTEAPHPEAIPGHLRKPVPQPEPLAALAGKDAS